MNSLFYLRLQHFVLRLADGESLVHGKLYASLEGCSAIT